MPAYTFTRDLAVHSRPHVPPCMCCGEDGTGEYRASGFPAELGAIWLCENCVSQAHDLSGHALKYAADLNFRAQLATAFAKSLDPSASIQIIHDPEELDP